MIKVLFLKYYNINLANFDNLTIIRYTSITRLINNRAIPTYFSAFFSFTSFEKLSACIIRNGRMKYK